MAKFNILRILIVLATKFGRDILQFDVKNVFLQGNNGDHTLFIKHMNKGGITVVSVYQDDILITWNDGEEIKNLREGLAQQFDVKSLEQ